MDGFFDPIDFSGIVGYPHDISEDVIDNIPDFYDHDHAGAHIWAFTKCIEKWCDPPIYEDVLMQLFVFTLCGDRANDWFHHSPDKTFKTIRDLLHAFLNLFGRSQHEIHNELVDSFMETWRRKNLPNIKTISSDIEVDAPSNPIEEFKEIIQNVQLSQEEQCETMNEQLTAIEDQLEVMEDDFTEAYIEYPDPLELELDREKDEEVHGEILDEYMDESVIYFEEVKEFEFKNVEYLDNSSPHPPPVEPISLEENLDNLEENSIMVPLTCSFPTSQPKEDFVHNSGKMEGNFSLSMSYHYEYWLAFHLGSHEQQNIKILRGLSYSSVWLKGRRSMILGWFFLAKISKLIKLGKGSSVSHPGQGCFRHLWLHSIQCMDGCNVSLTLLLYFNFVFFHLLCDYVLRCIFVS
jgi:hypothetical protein